MITWEEFSSLVKEKINPLVTVDVLETVAEGLMDIGEVIVTYSEFIHIRTFITVKIYT